jgi:hypothetical protein
MFLKAFFLYFLTLIVLKASANSLPSDKLERTFILIKPNAVERGIVGEVIKRFEMKGFRLVAMKFVKVK